MENTTQQKGEKMAEGMEVDPAPVVRDKKRFEVKKVTVEDAATF